MADDKDGGQGDLDKIKEDDKSVERARKGEEPKTGDKKLDEILKELKGPGKK